MNSFLLIIPEILASVITAVVTVLLAFSRFKSSAKIVEFSRAELEDRLHFRRSLMARVTELEAEVHMARDEASKAQVEARLAKSEARVSKRELAECHKSRLATEKRLTSLEALIK